MGSNLYNLLQDTKEMKDKRLAHLRQLLEAEPNDPFLNYAIGIEHFNSQDFEEAKGVFQSLLDRSPDYVPTYYQFAMTLVHLGDADGAIEVIEKGIPIARKAGEKKTANELTMLLEDLED